MENSWSPLAIRLMVLLILPAFAALPVNTAPASEEYYSADLDDAIAAARHNPVRQEYVGASWYNRSTSLSFPLPRLLNAEMDKEVIEGAMGPTAAGEAAAVEAQQPVRDNALGRQLKRDTLGEGKKKQDRPDDDEEYERNDAEIYIPSARSGNSQVRNIRATVSVKASARP